MPPRFNAVKSVVVKSTVQSLLEKMTVRQISDLSITFETTLSSQNRNLQSTTDTLQKGFYDTKLEVSNHMAEFKAELSKNKANLDTFSEKLEANQIRVLNSHTEKMYGNLDELQIATLNRMNQVHQTLTKRI